MIRSRRTEALGLLPLYVAILACLALPASPAAAEEITESPLRAGAWGLEFEIDPTLSYGLGYGRSATLSIKRFSSARRAWRLGLAVAFYESNADGERSDYRFPDPYGGVVDEIGSEDSHTESHDYRLFLHAVRRYEVREELAMVLEAGPSIRYQESSGSSEYYRVYSSPYTHWFGSSETLRGATLDAVAGFEWFFSKRLSLGARYGAYAGYQWGKRSDSHEDYALDGSFYTRTQSRSRVNRAELSTTRATVLFTAYL